MRVMKTITRQGFLLLILLCSLSGIAKAQVVIKEQIDISPKETAGHQQKKGNTILSEIGVVSGFIMPKTGQLQVYYTFCSRLDRILPYNAALIVEFAKGDSSVNDQITPRFPNITSWSRSVYNRCFGEIQYHYEYDYTNSGSPEGVYLYNAGHVAQGDTVKFFYSTDNIETGSSVLYGIYNAQEVRLADGTLAGWNVTFGDYDYCIGDFNDRLDIFVGVLEKEEPKLVILQPTTNAKNEHITHEPKMPTVTCKARLQNYNGGQVSFNWEYKVDYNLQTRSGNYPYKGSSTAFRADTTTWNVPFNNIFRGGVVTLTLTATTSEGSYTAAVSPNSILGNNPSPSETRSGVDLAIQVLMYKESRFRQFLSSGYPLYGRGKYGGYGICQLDNPRATEQQLWNWKDNRDRGTQILADKTNLAAGYAGRVRAGKTWFKDASQKWHPYDPVPFRWYGEVSPTGKYIRQIPYLNACDLLQGEELLKETFQRYNGGHYWRWVSKSPLYSESQGDWKPEPTNNYGNDWWKIYQDVSNGQPPKDWN